MTRTRQSVEMTNLSSATNVKAVINLSGDSALGAIVLEGYGARSRMAVLSEFSSGVSEPEASRLHTGLSWL